MTKRLLYSAFGFLMLLAGITPSSGQKATFDLNAPVTVQTGQRFRVEFTLSNADGDEFTGPSFEGFNVLAGPTRSQGSSFQSVNGKSTSSTFITWTYILEAPEKECSLKISPATVVAGGKTYSTATENIDVTSGGQSSTGGGGSGSGQPAASRSVKSDDVLLRMDLSSTNVYRGEPIVATLNLYIRAQVSGIDNVKYSPLTGFWSQELKVDENSVSKATVSGKTYEVHPLRRWILYPQKSGSLTIDPTSLTAVIAVVVDQPQSSGSLFDNMFGGFGSNIEYINKNLSSGSVKVNVKDLPQPQPASFDGAVGEFTMESSASSSTISANTAGSITVKLKGSGNFPTITDPKIQFPAAFESYDTKSTDNVQYSAKGGAGERSWEFPFITRVEGKYTIPGVEISYFSPKEKKYKTLHSGDFTFEVTPDSGKGGQAAGTFISGVTKQDLKMLGQDIRYIKTPAEKDLATENRPMVWSWWFYAVLVLIIAAFIAALKFLKKYIRIRSDVARTKNRKANKVALRRLKKSKGYMNAGNRTKFFEEMLRALWGYMGDKLTIDIANLTKERVRNELSEKGISEEQTEQFLGLVSDCEMAQYSPEMGFSMEEIYQQALDIIGNLEIH